MNLQLFLPFIIAVFGLVFLFKLRFFFILHPIRCSRRFYSAIRNTGAGESLILSLAGTLGVGNIVGVAYGIYIGGAGTVFWLLLSSVFSMAIKYAECTVCADSRVGEYGGIMYVIKNNFKRLSAPLSKLYAILIVFLSLTMGSTLQFRSAVECIDESNKQAIYIFSAIFIIFVLIAILGGTDRITRACKYAIPLASILYIVMALSVIIINASGIPRLIVSIFKSAFNFRAATGGVSAFLFSKALSEGFSRGLLSNEAGAGTSGIAHSRNTSASPATVGLFGICEVFADTVILCPLTAFAILLSLDSSSITKSGAETVKNALSTLGAISSPLLFACIALFAYSTVICWFYYGRVALGYLKVGHTGLFTLIFLLSLVCGTIIETGYLIYASDAILFSLCVISLFAISKSSDRLIALSEADGLL